MLIRRFFLRGSNMKTIITSLLFILSSSVALAQDDGLKIHISVDLEGIAGAVTGDPF